MAGTGLTAERIAGGERIVLLVVVGAVAALAWAALLMSVPSAGSGHHAVLLPHARTADLVGFALGLMNLLWMAVLTTMLCVEKIAPGGRILSRLFGVALAAWGLWLLLG